MIGVDKFDDIRRLGRSGASVASIARDTGVSEPTVRKHLREPDLSERPPVVGRAPESPLLEPFAETIDSWLREDRRCWHKRRHTARKVFDRLVEEEEGFRGSYSTVQRYVRRRRGELAAELDAREAQGFLLLDWAPGECQVDFGQADFRVCGVVTRGHFLVLEFPHSNVGLAQVFWGETAECVCQGLRDVFEFLGGVPLRAVFDNATEVGRGVGAEIRTSELFRRFAAHYGLDHGFTNPHSGNEKGSVENKVGTLRRNLFVPMPQVWDVRSYNERLLGTCPGLSDGKPHYRKGASESELFGDDRAALSPLPAAPFACVTWLTRKCDKQGSFRARDEGRLDREASQIGRARLLVVDELGFLPLDPDGARLLFQVFADAYERQSVVITTNLELSRWGSVFGDDQMAAAVIDRVVHHGRLVQFRGESYRVRHALMQEG